MVSTQDSESCDPSSSLGRTFSFQVQDHPAVQDSCKLKTSDRDAELLTAIACSYFELILMFQNEILGIAYIGAFYICKFPFPCGLVVRISGFHPGGRGSIPRTGAQMF